VTQPQVAPAAKLYWVLLLNRGAAPERVRAIETEIGGDPDKETPYRLPLQVESSQARRLIARIRRAGGAARVIAVQDLLDPSERPSQAFHSLAEEILSEGIPEVHEIGEAEGQAAARAALEPAAGSRAPGGLGDARTEEAGEPEGLPPCVHVHVFYGTTRARSGSDEPATFYGNKRFKGETPELGRCTVSVPTDRRMGELTSPHWLRREDPKKHVMLIDVQPLESELFYHAIKERVGASEDNDAFVFVHGFKTSFKDAIRRTGQLAYDLAFKGAPVCFSWPTNGRFLGYPVDEATVEWTAPYLKRFLLDLVKKSGAQRVHLLAHSMGNRALTRALDAIATDAVTGLLFHEIILAAPDVDADVFRQLAPAIRSKALRVTLYASSKDRAIRASKVFHGYPRAGETGKRIVVVRGVDTVDASAVNTEFAGHSYFGSNKSVISDLFALIHNGLPPHRRPGLVARLMKGALRYWCFVP